MGDYFVYCSMCGCVDRELGSEIAASRYVRHKSEHKGKGEFPDLFIRKGLEL